MSANGTPTKAIDRGTFQKLAVAAIVPTLVAGQSAQADALGASSTIGFTHGQLRKLLEDVVGSALDSLKAIEFIIKERDRCPPDRPPNFPNAVPHSPCRHYYDALKDLNDFLKDLGNPGYL